MPTITIDQTNLDVWAERDRVHIALRQEDGSEFKDGPIIAQWWDEDAQQMFEDGFFSSDGVIMGRIINPRPLHTSVFKYCETMGLLPEDPRIACSECGSKYIRKRLPKGSDGFTCEYCIEQWQKDNPKAFDPAQWRRMLRSARTFQEA